MGGRAWGGAGGPGGHPALLNLRCPVGLGCLHSDPAPHIPPPHGPNHLLPRSHDSVRLQEWGSQDGLRGGNKVSTFSLPLLKGPRNQLPTQRKVLRNHIPPLSVCPSVRPSVSDRVLLFLRTGLLPTAVCEGLCPRLPPNCWRHWSPQCHQGQPSGAAIASCHSPLQVTGLWAVIWP